MGIKGISILHASYDEWLHYSEGLNMADTQPHHDEEDVLSALQRATSDGPSEDSFDPNELSESDFEEDGSDG